MADRRRSACRPDVASCSQAELQHYINSRRERAWLCTGNLLVSILDLAGAVIKWIPATLEWLIMEVRT